MGFLMLNIFKPLALPPQLKWKRAEKSELIGWTIRAYNYTTLVPNAMLRFLALVLMGLTYALTHSHRRLRIIYPAF